MRRASRIDANHRAIVAALRDHLCSVQDLSRVGGGCPDLLVGWRGRNVLIEIKDGAKSPSERRLTADQVDWHRLWRGQRAVAYSVEDALRIVGIKEATE